jgi:hypothetical protein
LRNTQPGAAELTWQPGTDQAGYVLVRTRVRTHTTVRFNLGPTMTSFRDVPPLSFTTFCYTLLAVDASGQTLAQSDVICFRPRTRFGPKVPGNFAARLDQSNTATLSWDAASRANTRYLLLALPTTGSAPRVTTLPAGTRTITDDTRGLPTCYILFAVRNGRFPSRTDMTCVVPGQSTFDRSAPHAAVDEAQTRLEAATANVDQVDEVNTPPTTTP